MAFKQNIFTIFITSKRIKIFFIFLFFSKKVMDIIFISCDNIDSERKKQQTFKGVLL